MCLAQQLEPGLIVADGAPFTGAFDIGRYPAGVDEVAETFARDVSESACIATPRPNIMDWKYAKLLRNLGNSLDALLGDDLDEDARAIAGDIQRRATDEARRCLDTAGIVYVTGAEWDGYRFAEASRRPVEAREYVGSSTWQSLVRGTGNVEVDYISGEIVLLGRRYDVATPVNLALQREVNALSVRNGRPGDLSAQNFRDRLSGRESSSSPDEPS